MFVDLIRQGRCVLNCAPNYRDCDADPRNGCETDVSGSDASVGEFAWTGQCTSACNVAAQTSCGANLCVDCTRLPGIVTTPATAPQCVLVEEVEGRVPALNAEDYNAIQYACGVATGAGSYPGHVSFQDTYFHSQRFLPLPTDAPLVQVL